MVADPLSVLVQVRPQPGPTEVWPLELARTRAQSQVSTALARADRSPPRRDAGPPSPSSRLAESMLGPHGVDAARREKRVASEPKLRRFCELSMCARMCVCVCVCCPHDPIIHDAAV